MKKLLIALCVVMLLSCAGKKSAEEVAYQDLDSSYSTDIAFDKTDTLHADSVSINEVIQPVEWVVTDDKMVINTPKSENVFYVYGLTDFNFLYSFGQKGEGPDEFRFPNLLSGSKEGSVAVKDMSGLYTTFDIKDTNAVRNNSVKTRCDDVDMWVISVINDSFLVNRASGSEKYQVIKIEKDGSLSVIDEVPSMCVKGKEEPININGMELAFTPTYNVPEMTSNGGNIAFLYNACPRMDIFSVSENGEFVYKKSIGDLSSLKELSRMDFSEKDKFCPSMEATSERIYAFYNDYVCVWDWSGNGVAKYFFDKKVDKFTVDEDNNRIYAYNSKNDFETVYVFDIK